MDEKKAKGLVLSKTLPNLLSVWFKLLMMITCSNIAH
jgi:hypothetical protein